MALRRWANSMIMLRHRPNLTAPIESYSVFLPRGVCCLHVGLALAIGAVAWSWTTSAEGQTQALNTFLGTGGKSLLPKPSVDNVISWTDQHLYRQWRIQQHVESHACRLLDEDGKIKAEGTFAHCLEALESIKRAQHLEPMRGKAVVLLHGLAAPCWSMKRLAGHLRQHGEYEVFTVDYASLRSNIDDQARSLARVIQGLEGIEEINLVGHSMGNIVIRRYLAGDKMPSGSWDPDPRIHRIVMIAPPNHGSITATRLAGNSLFKKVFQESGQQLGVRWQELESRLATPGTEFGIIAGGCGNRWGFDPFLPGDDDGRLTVAETRLAGASDFVVVPSVHELIALNSRVFGYTLRFLKDGYFIAREERQSIPR